LVRAHTFYISCKSQLCSAFLLLYIDLTNLVQSLTERIQALNLENESLKLQIQNFDDIIRKKIIVELCNYLGLNSET